MNTHKCKNIVIGGAGSLIYSYIGAVKELFSDNELSKIQNYIGTSAGAILAMILACGANRNFLTKKAKSIDLTQFVDSSWTYVINMYNLMTQIGHNKSDRALNGIEDILEELTGNKFITFSQHYKKYKKNLVIIGFNVSKNVLSYFNRLNDPDMQISHAVRISISVPLLFCPFTYKGDIYVDGGVVMNYPISFITTDTFKLLNNYDEKIIGFKCEGSKVDLGYVLKRTIGIKTFDNKTNDEINIISYVASILGVLFDTNVEEFINENMLKRTVRIDSSSYNSMDFNIDRKTKRNMIKLGKHSAKVFKNTNSPTKSLLKVKVSKKRKNTTGIVFDNIPDANDYIIECSN
jgi:NTE family protein